MKTELKKELQNAQDKRSRSGVGFENLSEKRLELEEKLIAVRSEICHTFENIRIPELTRKVKEVLALADEVDPENLYGSERRRKKYGPLKSYLHSWQKPKEKPKEELKECPVSDDSKALLEFLPSLGELYSKSDDRQEMTEEVKELREGDKRSAINQMGRNIETKCCLFLYNQALPLIKKAKKLGLPINHGFELEIKRIFKDEEKVISQNREYPKYFPDYLSHEERIQGLFNTVISYLGHCQVANFLMNKLTEDLEFTRDLLEKAVAIYKESVDRFCFFLEKFSKNIRKKAESFYLIFCLGGDADLSLKDDELLMKGISLERKTEFLSMPFKRARFRI